ncbi:MAG: hypothetical protein HY925_07585, partial [Elusimicrobia bacterium]|nr:hypothetical protein [Elusimicrobiota bacterium]
MNALLVALALSASAAPTAAASAPADAAAPAAKPKRPAKTLPGVDVELKTKDGWTLSAKYQAATLPKP